MTTIAAQFVALPPERRALAFAQTAARMAASSAMVEKEVPRIRPAMGTLRPCEAGDVSVAAR